jgi:hypothetical protein
MSTRTLNLLLVVMIVFSCACSARKARLQQVEAKKKETTQATVDRLKTPVQGETDDEKRIRLRALELTLERQLKEVEADKKKLQTPEERKAERELTSAVKKNSENIAAEQKAKLLSGLSCPNEGDIDFVHVAPGAVQNYHRDVRSTMTVINKTNYPATIRLVSGSGPREQVDKLCPGGVMTLIQWIGWGTTKIVAYSAIVTDEAGKVWYDNSPQVFLQSCQTMNCQREFSQVWEIRPR